MSLSQHELYVETKVDGEDAVWQEVLFIGDEQQCIRERSIITRDMQYLGRIVRDIPDVHDPVCNGISNKQFVATHLGTPQELHMQFIIARR